MPTLTLSVGFLNRAMGMYVHWTNLAALAEQSSVTSLLPLIGVGMVTAGAMLMLQRRRRRLAAQPAPPSPREMLERDRQERGVRSDMERVMVEIEQLAKRFGAQLDAKSIQLEKLIQEADERIARLDRQQAAAGSPGWGVQPATAQAGSGEEPSPFSVNDAAQNGESDDPLPRRVHRLSEQGMTPEQIAKELGEHIGKVELILALRRA